MSEATHTFLVVDFMPLLAGVLAALACGLIGNFLVLRRLSMMGDTISHAVLPGIVAAFLIFDERARWFVLLGAGFAGVAAAMLVELVRRLTRLETGASMGVVFTIMFALGIVMIERASVRHLDLDADCLLYGQVEYLFWDDAPDTWRGFLSREAWLGSHETTSDHADHAHATSGGVPVQIVTLVIVTILSFGFVGLLFKELRLAAFDPLLATALGFHAGWLHVLLMVFVALAVVASFEAVGSILVIAMLICPGATARLLTDRLGSQLGVSAVVAVVSGVLGYFLAAFGPGWFGSEHALSASGMIAVVAGVILTLAIVLAPRHGLIAGVLRRRALAISVVREDIAAMLFRMEELGEDPRLARAQIAEALGRDASRAIAASVRGGELRREADAVELTDAGRDRARSVVRSHRLWESYLVDELGLRPDHVHDTAMQLEHLRAEEGRIQPSIAAETDPHDRPIP